MMFVDWMRAGIVLCMVLVRGPNLVWFVYVLQVLVVAAHFGRDTVFVLNSLSLVFSGCASVA